MKNLPFLVTLSSALLAACAHAPPTAPAPAPAPAATPTPTATPEAVPDDPIASTIPAAPTAPTAPAAAPVEERDPTQCEVPMRAYPSWCHEMKPRVQPKAKP